MFEFSVSKFAVLVKALFLSLMGTFVVGSEWVDGSGVYGPFGKFVVGLVLRFVGIVVK